MIHRSVECDGLHGLAKVDKNSSSTMDYLYSLATSKTLKVQNSRAASIRVEFISNETKFKCFDRCVILNKVNHFSRKFITFS